MAISPDLTIFFDGACPLCRREIAHYLSQDRARRLAAIDIATDPTPLAAIGVTQADALAALHARDADGRTLVGAAAFLAIWARLPRWRALAWTIRVLPGAPALLDRLYRAVAPRRARIAAALCGEGRCAR
jgi:predicted DCC family thiol-disulfide oxidoreductase YuxK